jgi:DNA-binding transcriptional LysR family regulator
MHWLTNDAAAAYKAVCTAMDLKHARTFVTVADLGTVSKAAVRLHIAQPALSRQIANLEQELGFRLFDRVGRRLVLTGEGEQLLPDCRHLLGQANALRERAQLLRGGDTGTLKVAASPQFIESVMADFLHGYHARYPNVKVKVIESIAWPDTLGMLERGEIHLGQNLVGVVKPDDTRFAMQLLERVDVLAACREPLEDSRRGAIDIGRLAAHPLLVLDTSFVSRRTFDATCRLAGIDPNIVFESRTPHTLLAMAEGGHGVAIVPSAVKVTRYGLSVARLTYRGKPLHHRLALFWDAQRPLPPYAAALCEMLAEFAREVFPITLPTEVEAHAEVRERATRRSRT